MSNCLFEATLQSIERRCGCTPKYYLDVDAEFEACEGKDKKCMQHELLNMGDQRAIIDGGIVKVNMGLLGLITLIKVTINDVYVLFESHRFHRQLRLL
jgi:hypothetical protein